MLRSHLVPILATLAASFCLFNCAPTTKAPTADTSKSAAQYEGRWLIEFSAGGPRSVGWVELNKVGSPDANGLIVGAPGGGMYPLTSIKVLDSGALEFTYKGKWGSNIPEVAKKENEERKAIRDAGKEPPEREEVAAVYTAKLEGDTLVGKQEWPDAPGRFNAISFTAKKAPEIHEHDDGTWVAGETVTLVGEGIANPFTIPLDKETGWSLKNGLLTNFPPSENLESKDKFWNFDLHAEYRLFDHSNSGIGLRGRYEVQIAESFGKEPHKQGHAALYYRLVPTSNPSKKIGEWQAIDVRLIGREVSVTLNGVKVIDKGIIDGLTAMATNTDEANPGPITIQGDHEKVEFRKFTVTRLEKKAN